MKLGPFGPRFPRWLLAALGIAVAAVCWLSRGRDVVPATPRSEEHEHAVARVERSAPGATANPRGGPSRIAAQDADIEPTNAGDVHRIHVVDMAGSPIAGAFVGTSTECTEDPDDWAKLLPLGRSDARGELRVR